MGETIQKITNYFNDFINSDKYRWSNDKEGVLKRKIESYTLFLNTDMSIVEIEEFIRKKYNINTPFIQTKKDFVQYNFLLNSSILNMNPEDIRKRFSDEDVEERMLFRIELYKEGWSVDQIEKYVYHYMLKEELPELDLSVYLNFYHNLIVKLNVISKEKEKIKGRPSLPPLLKEYVKNKHSIKVKNNMRQGYKKQALFDSIKDSLLTKEEIQKVENMFVDKNDSTLLKIKGLYIRDI